MSVDLASSPMKDRFDHLFNVITGTRFLNMEGISNEVPFFICPYAPKESIQMEKLQKQLLNKLEQNGTQVLSINLYDLCIEILKREGDLDWYIENEAEMPKPKLLEELQNILDVKAVIIPEMNTKMHDGGFDVMFISGVGEVFPYIRSHNILNNLQSTAKDKPTLMFFPGSYTQKDDTGASLDLFGKLHDDKYYRAFNIYHREP